MICGHQKIVRALQKNIKKGEFAHAYIFSGPEGIGKKIVALNFIKTIQCQNKQRPCGRCQSCLQIEKNIHPDTIIFQKQGEIKIGEMREIQKKMNLKPYGAPYKILLLDNAENLNEEAANSLLKFLEEPKGAALIILITANITAILPTIVSRCVVVNFFPVGKKEMLEYFESKAEALQSRTPGVAKLSFTKETQKLNLEELINQSFGRPGKVINWLKNPAEFLENKQTIGKFKEAMTDKNIAQKFQFISQFYKKRENSLKLLTLLLGLFQQLLLIKIEEKRTIFDPNLASLAKIYKIDKIRNALLQIVLAKRLISQNANLKLVLENVMLNL